jgi:hypothetical protein
MYDVGAFTPEEIKRLKDGKVGDWIEAVQQPSDLQPTVLQQLVQQPLVQQAAVVPTAVSTAPVSTTAVSTIAIVTAVVSIIRAVSGVTASVGSSSHAR